MQNELAGAYQSPNPQTNEMAAQGRKGDAMMAHVTPGDYVIPKDILVQHPDFLVKLKKVMGDENEDYRTHMVGSGFENINPETGAAEFGFGKAFKRITQSVGNTVGGGVSKILPEAISQPLGGALQKASPMLGMGFGSNYMKGVGQGISGPAQAAAAPAAAESVYSPTEMKLPGSLQELGGLTDQQRRAYLATQGSQGSGLGGSSRDYYANLLQRNIQADQGSLLPVESQFLGSQGINPNLQGQALIEALRGF
jgi:hypothetical protein